MAGDLRSALTAIYRAHGELTPELVVAKAKNKRSSLHHHFEWDDTVAGDAYRRMQATRLIRSVPLNYDPKDRSKYVRAFSSVRWAGDPAGKGYQPTEDVLADPMSSRILLREFERAINDLKRTYGHLQEFSAMLLKAASGGP